MNTENKVSVILPIKSGKAISFVDFFDKAIQSVKNQKDYVNELIIVHGSEDYLTSYLTSYDFGDLNVVLESWSEEPNFGKQVNHGVSIANSNWCSILEFDDEYSNIWFKNAINYMDIYKNVDAFLPIVVDIDDKLVFAGFTNEATFAQNISSEMGILTNETLQTFQNFQTSGMVFKKEKFLEVGGFKSNLKLTFGYELFLRLTHNSARIMTIPRIGYKHMNLREGSIFWNYKNGDNRITQDEAKFWIDSAKKEYFFTNERDINYEPQEI
jgi:glycosyltransferase involved in cell wall biosynthesis